MPRIAGYERQVGSDAGIPARRANPNDFGGTGLSELGAGIQSAGQDFAFAQRQLQAASSARAVTDVHVALSTIRGEYTKLAAEVENSAEPGDTEVGTRFLLGREGDGSETGLKWALDSYRENLQDPAAIQAFDVGAAHLTEHFSNHFVNVQARMASNYAKQSYTTMLEQGKADVESHPEIAEFVLNNTHRNITDPNGIYARIPSDAREALIRSSRRDIFEYQVRGLIRQNPTQTLADLQQGKWNDELDAEKKVALESHAQVAIHAQDVAKNQAAAELEKQRIALAREADGALIEKLIAHDGNPSKNPMLKPQDILDSNLARLDPSKALTLINLLNTRAKEDPHKAQHTNPIVMHRLFQDIHRPDSDPKKMNDTDAIYKEYIKGNLKFDDMNHLRKELTDARSGDGSIFGREKAEFYKRIGPQILKPGPFGVYTDPTTPDQFYRFTQDVDAMVKQYRKDNKDPRVLFDPNSQEYAGRPAFVRKYQSSGFGSLATTPAVPQPAPAPAQPAAPGAPAPAAPAKKKSLDDIFGFKK